MLGLIMDSTAGPSSQEVRMATGQEHLGRPDLSLV